MNESRQILSLLDANGVTWLFVAIVGLSLYQGIRRGASGSARQLVQFLADTLIVIISVVLSAIAASAASPWLQEWIAQRGIDRPGTDASATSQFLYTVLSGLHDLPLFRFAALFLLSYFVIRLLIGWVAHFVVAAISVPISLAPASGGVNRLVGGALGAVLGTGRALLLTAVLFAYCAMLPQGPLTGYIQQSALYREAAAQVIEPAAGHFFEQQLPVFARAMSHELDQLWQKRYDIIDAELSDDIVQAALSITEGKESEEEKARALYDWVGSRIAYDDDKVIAYEEFGEWREQDPMMTFQTRKGVCIDYARLYASMARAIDLDVRVVTGLGYDGRGGYGPHAWNEVYSTSEQRWISLDPTWARTGDWFDRPGFSDTHIRQGGLQV